MESNRFYPYLGYRYFNNHMDVYENGCPLNSKSKNRLNITHNEEISSSRLRPYPCH